MGMRTQTFLFRPPHIYLILEKCPAPPPGILTPVLLFLIKTKTCTEVSLSKNFNILFQSVPWDDIMKSGGNILGQYLFHLAAS